MENRTASSAASATLEAPQGVATLLDAGDLEIELSTVQEETFFDQNEECVIANDGCYCNPGKSCC